MFSDNYDGTFIGTTDKCNARNFKPDAAGLFYYGAAKICCKKILGNAYHIRMGKIYNLSDLYNHCPDCTSDKFWNSGKWSSEKYIDPTKTSFYIASEITSKSRAYLGKIALDVAFSNNNICYTDTDSLHIEILNEKALNKALEKYIDNNKIGMLKHEGDFEYALWFSKKHYYLFNEINNKLVLTKDWILNMLKLILQIRKIKF